MDANPMTSEMKVVMNHIYEFRKGVRPLVLCTLCRTCAGLVAEKLERQGIAYLMQPLRNRVNLFFGRQECLDAVACFIDKPLNMLTDEEDFMLGVMLGYDINEQCRRFCDRRLKYSRLAQA